MPRRFLSLLALAVPLLAADTAASLSARLREMSLDPDACYRIRDMGIQREDLRLYFTDGWLIFGRPIAGRRVIAAFVSSESGDDAEVLLRPPDRSERASLAAATGSPNLNEHFKSGILLFTDSTSEEMLKQIKEKAIKPDPEMGLLLAGRMNEVVRNFCGSFQVRLVFDLLAGRPQEGLFYAAISGLRLGNFDLMYDPMLPEQLVAGQVGGRKSGVFEIWTSFQSRSMRQGGKAHEDEAALENYRIEAILTPELRLDVTTRLTVRPRRRIQGALPFEIAPQMEVTSVLLDGKPVEIFRRESLRESLVGGRINDPFLVVLPDALEASSAHELEFHHSGKVVQPAGNNVYYVAARTNWYPTRGYQFTTFDLTFRVPKGLRVVATGDQGDEKEEGDWLVVRRRTSAPVRLAGFNVGAYESVETVRGGYKVQVYANRTVEPALQPKPQTVVLPPSTSPRAQILRPGDVITIPAAPTPNPRSRMDALATEISGAMEWMASQFGPAPLKTLTVSPIPGFFGQGFPGLIYLSTVAFLREQERPANLNTGTQSTFYSEILHAHETAHQWWGNLVSAASYHDDWLLEALANYSALLVLERKKGPKALEAALDEYFRELRVPAGEERPDLKDKPLESAGPITWGVRLRADGSADPWRAIVYGKGSWIMHMLRRRMGDAQFLAFLGAIRKRFAYEAMTTEQFRQLAAEYSPKGLPDPTLQIFFDNWVYSTGIPTLELTSAVKGRAPAVALTVTVRQSGDGCESGLDVPVEIRLPGAAKPLVKWVRTGSEPATFAMKLQAAPVKVELAPGAGVLAFRK